MSGRRSSRAFGVAAYAPFPIAASAMLVLSLFGNSGSLAAELHKCVDKSRTVYQDYPCNGPGSVLRTWPDDKRATSDPEALAKLSARVAEIEQARKARETQFDIEGIEREIRGYVQAEEDELAELRARKSYADYNLQGAPWERVSVLEGIAKDMRAVTEKYAAKKKAALDRIAQLRGAASAAPAAR